MTTYNPGDDRAWCILNPRHPGSPFGPYATREEAESLARELRRIYPGNTYHVRPDPDFRRSEIPSLGLAPASSERQPT